MPSFAKLKQLELKALLSGARERQANANEQVIGRGESSNEMLVLLSGRLRVSVASHDGRELTFRLVEPVDIVGEIAALDGRPRTADVTAVLPSRLLVIRRDACLAAMREHPALVEALIGLLCTRIRETSAGLERLAMQRLSSRMAHLLLRLAADYGQPMQDGVRLPMRLSQSEIGTLVAATREAVNKQLRYWRDEGVLDLVGGQIVLLRTDVLLNLVE
jgi:CRP-like cAMP-binding protein